MSISSLPIGAICGTVRALCTQAEPWGSGQVLPWVTCWPHCLLQCHSKSTAQQEGKIRTTGISSANIEEIEVALQVLGEAIWSACRTSLPQISQPRRIAVLPPTRDHVLPWIPLPSGGSAAVPATSRTIPSVRRHRQGSWREPAAGRARLGTRPCDSDPPIASTSVDHRLRPGDLRLNAEELDCCSTVVALDLVG